MRGSVPVPSVVPVTFLAMTSGELVQMLHAAERSPGWLAGKVGRSRTQVKRWMDGSRSIPEEKQELIRDLLRPVPTKAALARLTPDD